MKRARPVASLVRERGFAQIRLGGDWPAPFVKADRYRAQTSALKGGAELTRLAFMLEALPSTRCKGITFIAMASDPIALRWIDKLTARARRHGLPCTVQTIGKESAAMLALVVLNRGGRPKKDPAEYDRMLARRDARYAAKRERSKAARWAKMASECAEWEWWEEQRAEHEAAS